ncbi:hypothetical protein K0U00_07530 [Paenibacillus sepulcri]|uniref:Uncharacterized protein n=1 Tax=Paenibacillus sepulcri TaxID=359917 RepID=A0ABS7BZ29_9BACL|nr:hypothetical protein [Paenibacillus sepulcri]
MKPLQMAFILSYCYFPVTALAKAHFKGQFEVNEDHLQQIIRMSWDAVRA